VELSNLRCWMVNLQLWLHFT